MIVQQDIWFVRAKQDLERQMYHNITFHQNQKSISRSELDYIGFVDDGEPDPTEADLDRLFVELNVWLASRPEWGARYWCVRLEREEIIDVCLVAASEEEAVQRVMDHGIGAEGMTFSTTLKNNVAPLRVVELEAGEEMGTFLVKPNGDNDWLSPLQLED